MKTIDDNIIKALKKTFSNSKIPKNITNLKIGDIKEWDSLGNFHLILEIEKLFKCRFDTKAFNEIKSIKSLKKEISIKWKLKK
jgi:acyl carrier protein